MLEQLLSGHSLTGHVTALMGDTRGGGWHIVQGDVVVQDQRDVGVELCDEVVAEQPDDNVRESVLVE